MSFLATYRRVIGLLSSEKVLATGLALASLALAAFQLAEPILFGRVVDALAKGEPAMHLVLIWAIVGFLGVAANVTIALHADRLAHRRRLAAMTMYFEHAIALPPSYLGEQHSGRLMKVMLRGTDNLFSMWLSFFREHLSAIFSLMVLIPTALYMNWRLAAVLFVLMVLFAIANWFIVNRTYKAQGEVEQYHSEVASRAGDVMGNVAVVQSFTRLNAEVQGLQESMRRLLGAQFPVLTWWAMLTVLTKAASTVAMISLFAVGTVLHSQGAASVGDIVTFVMFANVLIGRLEQISGLINSLFFQTPAIAEFFGILDTESTVREKPGASEMATPRGEVEFRNLTYRYPNAAAGVFDVSFTVEAGQTVALVGPTGSGKSTALSFLHRVRDPDSGGVFIDGQDVRDVTLASLRRQIGVVFQDAGLFNRSILENLTVGRPEATSADVDRAVDLAEARDFIMSKPQGFDTIVAERGINFSGGERQRMAIARAILKDAPILILDEATSALDVETEAKIARALDKLSQGRTTLIIAHRLSTVRKADKIVVLKDGHIVEMGSFDELVAQGGFFSRLAAEGGLVDDTSDDEASVTAS
jgi:glucan exporter ATP-binding protein